MFDIGFWELIIIAVLGVLVVGPEKLPDVIRDLMRTVRKLRRMFAEVRSDIERELELDEMHQLLEENEVRSSLQSFSESLDGIDRDLRAATDAGDDGASDPGIETGFADTSVALQEHPSGASSAGVGKQVSAHQQGAADAAAYDGETYRDTGIDPPRGDAAKKDA